MTARPRKHLTAKQEAFCIHYFKGENATSAIIKAGYKGKYVANDTTKLLKNPKIEARLDELKAAIASPIIMGKREIEERLSEIARNGNPKQADPVMAIRELNKMEGYYAPEKHAVLGDIIIEVIYADRHKAENKNTG